MDELDIDLCLATKNSFSTLPDILHSIRNQTYFDNTRLLVADNKSNDGTLNELKKYNFTEIISYDDESPEDGFNKLLKKDQNNLKIIISSDDWLSKNYLEAFALSAKKLKKKGIKKFILLPMFYKNIGCRGLKIDLPLPIFLLNFIGICRGVGFGVYAENGKIPLFTRDIKFASDFEYLIKCLKDKFYFKYVFCRYYHNKNGRSAQNWVEALKEEKNISLKYNKSLLSRKFVKCIFGLKFILKK